MTAKAKDEGKGEVAAEVPQAPDMEALRRDMNTARAKIGALEDRLGELEGAVQALVSDRDKAVAPLKVPADAAKPKKGPGTLDTRALLFQPYRRKSDGFVIQAGSTPDGKGFLKAGQTEPVDAARFLQEYEPVNVVPDAADPEKEALRKRVAELESTVGAA